MSGSVQGGRERPARVGVLLPSGNTLAEGELHDFAPADVELFTTRVRLRSAATEEVLAMAEESELAAQMLADVAPDLVLFHCTGASALAGDGLTERVAAAAGAPATSTIASIAEAFEHLGCSRPVLVSPYPATINAGEVECLGRAGIEVQANVPLAIEPVGRWAELPSEFWVEAAADAIVDSADSVLLSCTNIRAAGAVEAIERALGLPVITSNQAAIWNVLRLLDDTAGVAGLGRLFETGRDQESRCPKRHVNGEKWI